MLNNAVDNSRSFHGWKVLFLAAFSQFVSVGFTVYLIGLYLQPLAEAFSASRGQLGWASSIFMLVAAGLGPLLGYWVDRGKIKGLMTLGALCMALGFILLSVCSDLIQASLVCIFLVTPGAAMLGIVTVGAMLSQWFDRRRGLALGVAAAGMSLGGFFMPPIAAWLFEGIGWRVSSLLLGIFIALTLLPCAWLIAVAKPSDIGQFSDGVNQGSDNKPKSVVSQQQQIRFIGLLFRVDFWVITLTIGTISFASISFITYLIPFSQEQGINLQSSAFMLSVYAGTAFLGKFFFGWLADKFSSAKLLTSVAAVMVFSLLLMLYVKGLVFFVISICILGLGVGGLMPVWSTLVASNFGPQAFGKVKGAMSLVLTSVSVIPGPLGGYIYEWQGSYSMTFNVVLWVLILGIVISLFIPGNSNNDMGMPQYSPAK